MATTCCGPWPHARTHTTHAPAPAPAPAHHNRASEKCLRKKRKTIRKTINGDKLL